MSRIGKQIITIPEKTTVTLDNGTLTVKGPLGELKRDFLPEVEIIVSGSEITLKITKNTKFCRSLWGTYASHIKNMVEGVNKGYEKKLIVEGVGYKYNVVGQEVVLDLGFSHQVKIGIPAGLKVVTEKNQMTVTGFNKELVGSFAAKIRSLKVTEPYKGKGIRYANEVVLRKQGKKTTA